MISRYQTDEMAYIWSEQAKFSSWLAVELQACAAFNKLGKITDKEISLLNKNATFDISRINEIELETRHDVVAFTRCISESLGNEKKWIHYGMTSTDVVDTAMGYNLRLANEIIQTKLETLIQTLKSRAIEFKDTVMMGRTHGVHAELTTFGYKLALYYDEMNRNLERFKLARKQIEVGKISGAVGTYANIDPFVQDYVCEALEIGSTLISTQTLQRDRHAFYISTITMIGNTLDKIGTELRHLQRTEVGEVKESFAKGQKGSSAMPHKKNPISSENICGLARVLRGYTVTANENVALWHERDISHSSAERIILADATSLIDYMLKRMNTIILNLGIDEQRMKKNIDITNGVFFSQKVLLTLTKGKYSREEAYDLVQPIALECFNNGLNFKTAIINKFSQELTKEEIEDCFDINYHLEKIDFIFKRLGLI